ncbi:MULTISPECIES: hypothetical protein [Sphingobium]|uniref:Uncharacterized protein n=2 Tax=Sphingobium cupriresistens TaxID=1132417 RepID=A0A0J7Y0L3_9SPHN|nr:MULTISPECIES: hypothetical protein [Sphingobium]KMS57349.1 hypothetical protein V473_03770 [Sphingobium cupriresistens LL01]MBJ7378551.1 hypothetical protein [Sphingobium sp.]RYM14863.1 hypothetical protein EWH12_00145 [Sphingobium cupriresistens]WCP14361.1 hypothetical protein sphantq_02806 [Sphingobium sp. AntQ-1]
MTETLRRLGGLALIYLLVLIGGFLLYLALIASPLLGAIPLLFYRGVLIAFIGALLLGLLLAIAARRITALDLSTGVGAVALSLAFNISFLIVFPVTFDRSITMFLLARIERQDGQLTPPMLEKLFVREYLGDLHQIDRRMSEQTLSGNIVQHDDGRIALTPQGRRLLSSARRIGSWFAADPRFVTAPQPAPPRH